MPRLRLPRRRPRQRDRDDEMTSPDLDAVPDETPYDPYDDYEEAAIEPFVPVSGDDEAYDYTPDTETAYPGHAPRRRVHVPRPHLPHLPRPRLSVPTLDLGIRWDYLLLALVLIVAGVFGALLNRGLVQDDVEEWWPLVIVVVAALWMVIALVRRQVAPFLGGAALAGVGLSLVMNNQDIADFKETLLGMVLVTAGLGIVIRGFVLRQRTPF
jgi:hypothetical protein